ncbi:MAG: EAL domain-containing protein [Tissierellia bacterium]|nr:EAL domain-containing protein [Tissierellia bacterium]
MEIISLLNIAYAILIASYHSNIYSSNRNETNKVILVFASFLSLWFIIQGYSLTLDIETSEMTIRILSSIQLFLSFSTIPMIYYLFLVYKNRKKNNKTYSKLVFLPYLMFFIIHFYFSTNTRTPLLDRKIGYDLKILAGSSFYSFVIIAYSAYYIVLTFNLLRSIIKENKSSREKKYAIKFTVSYAVQAFLIVFMYTPLFSDYSLLLVPLNFSIFAYILSSFMNKDMALANISDAMFSIFDNTEQAIAIIDSDFILKYNNKNFNKYFPEEDVKRCKKDISKLLEKLINKESLYMDFNENIRIDSNGEKRYMFVSNSSNYDKWFQYEGSILLFKDITKLTEQKVESNESFDVQRETLLEKQEEIRELNQNLTRTLAINHALEKRHEEIKEFDSLTGTLNKDAFIKHVNKIIDSKAKKLAVITIKIRDIKSMKDVQGYNFGNTVVKVVADILKDEFGRFAVISRYASETFLLAITNFKTNEEVYETTQALYEKIKEYRNIENYETSIKTVSGISIFPDHGQSAIDLISNSELAVYQAEEEDKSIVVFTEEILKEIHEMHRLNNEILEACKRHEFIPFFQPIIEIEKGNPIRTYEALARWDHPTKGITSPYFFIGVAEKTGSIKEITSLLLNNTCDKIRKFEEMGYDNFRFSINISPIELKDVNIFTKIENAIKEYGINPKHLELEITERGLIFDLNFTLHLLSRLKGLGVYISIDDFGTSFSSFNYLKNLPIDKLKIDKGFIDPIGTDEKRDMILKTIIDLSRNLGLETLAEGVEEESQFEFLKENGTEYIQGYYFYKPMPFEEIVKKGYYPGYNND